MIGKNNEIDVVDVVKRMKIEIPLWHRVKKFFCKKKYHYGFYGGKIAIIKKPKKESKNL